MFKIIGRILIILLVAAIVAGGLYALVQNGSTNSTAFTPDRQFNSQNTNGRPVSPDGFLEHESEGEFSLGHGLAGVLGTLLKVGVIAAGVLLVQNLLARRPNRCAVSTQ